MTDDATTARPRRRLRSADSDARTIEIVAPGRRLSGRYELLRELGRGGMGVVFEAEDGELENRRIAVKVLPPELAGSPKAQNRLRREAIAAMELTHPNILRLHGFEHDGDTVFLVMELLGGPNLEAAVAETETLPLEQVLAIAGDVCPALDYAHKKGVVHRDIKPANLMYDGPGDDRTVKVTDFGIAYVVRDSMTRLTGIESSGTPLYVAPEQLLNDPPDGRSDQYSLAATLYELLAGDPPFYGAGLSHRILEAPARPIADLPDGVNAALLRALAKKPDERFATCSDFCAALRDGTTTATVTMPTPAPQPQAPQPQTLPAKAPVEAPAKPAAPRSTLDSFLLAVYLLIVGLQSFAQLAMLWEFFGRGRLRDEESQVLVLATLLLAAGPLARLVIDGWKGRIEPSVRGTVAVVLGMTTLHLAVATTGGACFDGLEIELQNTLAGIASVVVFGAMHWFALAWLRARSTEPNRSGPAPLGPQLVFVLVCLAAGFGTAFVAHVWAYSFGPGLLGDMALWALAVLGSMSVLPTIEYAIVAGSGALRFDGAALAAYVLALPLVQLLVALGAAIVVYTGWDSRLESFHTVIVGNVYYAGAAALTLSWVRRFARERGVKR